WCAGCRCWRRTGRRSTWRRVLVRDQPLAVPFGQQNGEACRTRHWFPALHSRELVEAGHDYSIVVEDDCLAPLNLVGVAASRELEVCEVGAYGTAVFGHGRAVGAE